MAGETINVFGDFIPLNASEELGSAAFSSPSNVSSIAAVAAGLEHSYPLLDFKLTVTSGIVGIADVINIYRHSSDGIDAEPIPSSINKKQPVGSFTINSNSEIRYLRGIVNNDPNDMFYLENTGGSVVTLRLDVRLRSYMSA